MLKFIAVGIGISWGYILFELYRKRTVQKDVVRILSIAPWLFVGAMVWSLFPLFIAKTPLRIFVQNPLGNVFFFYDIVRRLPSAGSTWALGILWFVLLSMIGIYACHISKQEKEIARLKSASGINI